MSETDFNQFMWLKNQLVVAAQNFGREENLPLVLIPIISKDIDEHLKLANKVVDVMERANKKNWVTLLRLFVDRPGSSYAQVQSFSRKKEDEKFQQTVYVNHELEELIYLLDAMNSVYDKVITNKSICNVLLKELAPNSSLLFFFHCE